MRTYTPPNAPTVPREAEKVFTGQIFDVYQWEQPMFDGSTKTFEMLKRPDTVEIIGVHQDKLILSKEQQPHTDTFIAFPSGKHDVETEDELAAAKRELKEETGYTFKNWKLINTRTGSNKIEQIVYYFLATELEEIGEQDLEQDGERIEVVEMTFDEYKSRHDDPMMKFYPAHIFDKLHSLDELLELPSLYDYDGGAV